MKTFIITLVSLIFCFYYNMSYAASTNTISIRGSGDLTIYTIDITADDTTGAIDDTTFTVCGYMLMATWDPSTPAPTDLLDAYLFEDIVNGVRVFGNRLVDLSAVVAKQVNPNVNNSVNFARPVCGPVILRVFNNSAVSAQMQFRFYVKSPF